MESSGIIGVASIRCGPNAVPYLHLALTDQRLVARERVEPLDARRELTIVPRGRRCGDARRSRRCGLELTLELLAKGVDAFLALLLLLGCQRVRLSRCAHAFCCGRRGEVEAGVRCGL